MKRCSSYVFALALVAGLTTAIVAGNQAYGCDKTGAKTASTGVQTASTGEAGKPCHGQEAGKSCADWCVEASTARLMAAMPQMTYKVGELETPCAHTAKSKADETGTAVTFVVDGQSYASREQAMDKLAEAITAHINETGAVRPYVDGQIVNCPKAAAEVAAEKKASVKYVLAGVVFEDKATADAVAAKLTAKMQEWGSTPAAQQAAATETSKSGCGHKAETASGSSAGCSGKKAETASGSGSGCSGKKAETASTGGCGKDCSKGCGKSATGAAQTASARQGGTVWEETPSLVQARQNIRRIVEFVATERAG